MFSPESLVAFLKKYSYIAASKIAGKLAPAKAPESVEIAKAAPSKEDYVKAMVAQILAGSGKQHVPPLQSKVAAAKKKNSNPILTMPQSTVAEPLMRSVQSFSISVSRKKTYAFYLLGVNFNKVGDIYDALTLRRDELLRDFGDDFKAGVQTDNTNKIHSVTDVLGRLASHYHVPIQYPASGEPIHYSVGGLTIGLEQIKSYTRA